MMLTTTTTTTTTRLMALYLGQLGELVPENHSQLPYLYKYYTISLTNHQFTMVHSILLV